MFDPECGFEIKACTRYSLEDGGGKIVATKSWYVLMKSKLLIGVVNGSCMNVEIFFDVKIKHLGLNMKK